jgi:hypothetical protein
MSKPVIGKVTRLASTESCLEETFKLAEIQSIREFLARVDMRFIAKWRSPLVHELYRRCLVEELALMEQEEATE